jgi:hypothetical protein
VALIAGSEAPPGAARWTLELQDLRSAWLTSHDPWIT